MDTIYHATIKNQVICHDLFPSINKNVVYFQGDLFNKAAEMATAAMKGRLANKYYQQAEEAYALEPDE